MIDVDDEYGLHIPLEHLASPKAYAPWVRVFAIADVGVSKALASPSNYARCMLHPDVSEMYYTVLLMLAVQTDWPPDDEYDGKFHFYRYDRWIGKDQSPVPVISVTKHGVMSSSLTLFSPKSIWADIDFVVRSYRAVRRMGDRA